MKTVFFLLFALALQAQPCSFTLPKGWECVKEKERPPGILYLAQGPTKNLFTPSINLASEPTDLTLDEYTTDVEKLYQEPTKTVLCLGSLQTAAGPMKVLQIDEKFPWEEIRILQGIVIKDHTAYVVTATMNESQFPTLITALLESMKSFSLTSGATKTS